MNYIFGAAFHPSVNAAATAVAASQPQPQWSDIAHQLKLGIVEGLKSALSQANAGVKEHEQG